MAKVIFTFEDTDDGQVSFSAEFDPELNEVDEDNPTDAQKLASVAFRATREFLDGTGGCKGSCGDCACK